MQTLRDLGVTRVRVNVAWGEIAPFAELDPAAEGLRRYQPGGVSGRRVGAVRRDRPRGRDDGIGSYVTSVRPAAVGAGSGRPEGHCRLLP